MPTTTEVDMDTQQAAMRALAYADEVVARELGREALAGARASSEEATKLVAARLEDGLTVCEAQAEVIARRLFQLAPDCAITVGLHHAAGIIDIGGALLLSERAQDRVDDLRGIRAL